MMAKWERRAARCMAKHQTDRKARPAGRLVEVVEAELASEQPTDAELLAMAREAEVERQSQDEWEDAYWRSVEMEFWERAYDAYDDIYGEDY